MGRIIILSLLLLVFAAVIFVDGSYLVVFWRDTMRRWKLEKAADEKRKLREANEELIASTELLDKVGREKTK